MNISNNIHNAYPNFLDLSFNSANIKNYWSKVTSLALKVTSFSLKIFAVIFVGMVIFELITQDVIDNQTKDFSTWGDFKTDAGLQLKLPGLPKKTVVKGVGLGLGNFEQYLYDSGKSYYCIHTLRYSAGFLYNSKECLNWLKQKYQKNFEEYAGEGEIIPHKADEFDKFNQEAVYYKNKNIYEHKLSFEDQDGYFGKAFHLIIIGKKSSISDEELDFFKKNIKLNSQNQ